MKGSKIHKKIQPFQILKQQSRLGEIYDQVVHSQWFGDICKEEINLYASLELYMWDFELVKLLMLYNLRHLNKVL